DIGVDNGTGSGLIQADKAVGFASTLSITATAAHPVMYGTHLADTFSGGAENDTFTGFGAGDTLIFAPGGLADTYRDFVPGDGGDIIDLTAFTNIRSLQAVLNRASQSGADTIITLSNADSVTLIGVTKGDLTRDNFVLAPARPESPPGAMHAADQAQDHIPTRLPPPRPQDVPDPATDHMSDVAVGYIPDWLILG